MDEKIEEEEEEIEIDWLESISAAGNAIIRFGHDLKAITTPILTFVKSLEEPLFQLQKFAIELSENVKILTEKVDESIEKNVSDGWVFFLGFDDLFDYYDATELSRDEKNQYFVQLIDDDSKGYLNKLLNQIDNHFEHLGWQETLTENRELIESGKFKGLLPFYVSMIEKCMNMIINGEKNYFGKDLKQNFKKTIEGVPHSFLISKNAEELKKLLIKKVLRNGEQKEIGEIFSRNLIQHGNSKPDEWSKVEFYQILLIIVSLIEFYDECIIAE